jgi:hypothetical protein
MGQLHKAQQIVGLAEKKRGKLLEKIAEQRRAAEAARIATSANPALAWIRAKFPYTRVLLALDDSIQIDMDAYVAEMKLAREALTASDEELARKYLDAVIVGFVGTPEEEKWATERAAEKAEEEQDAIDGRACQDAADAIRDKFAGLFGEGGSTASKDRLKALFQIVREEAQAQHKAIKPGEMTATGANRKKISSRILEELTAIASRLGKAGTEIGPQQSLENVQSLEWHSARSAQSMRVYVRELTARLEEARATMTPEEYKKKYMELPVAPKEEIIVWRVRLLNGREEWFWPSGKIVRRGVDVGSAEVIKDARLGWTLAPSPVGAELDDENKPVGKMEGYYDEMDCDSEGNPKWKHRPEGSGGEFAQQSDGSWKKISAESPWSKPEPITFKVGPAQPDAAHDEFRNGFWWTKSECEAAERGPDLKEPPVILPPLTRTKADSIALPPPMTKEELAKWSREPNRWVRHMQREKFRKEQEAALLKGTFIWDKNQATAE